MTRAQRAALRDRVDAKIAAVKAGTAVCGDLIAVVDPNEIVALLDRLDEAERLLGEVLPLLSIAEDNCTMSDEQACASVIDAVCRFVR